MNRLTIPAASLALALLALQACTKPPPPAASGARIYAHDVTGKAAVCTVPEVQAADKQDRAVTIATGGGGWCGLTLRNGNAPYAAGLLTQPARNGRVVIHTVGDDTRIDYTANPGPVAADSFAVRLIPGDATLHVSVTPLPPHPHPRASSPCPIVSSPPSSPAPSRSAC